MKNIFYALCVLLATQEVFAGQVGGSGGGTALTGGSSLLLRRPIDNVMPINELMKVYQGANKISREALGSDRLFKMDVTNRIVTFDSDRLVLEESETLTFEEVVELADPIITDDASEVFSDTGLEP